MQSKALTSAALAHDAGQVRLAEIRVDELIVKSGALQQAILNSANFSVIATDEKGIVQLFNAGAELMLGYAASDVVDKITPADISDPQELSARAAALSKDNAAPIAPNFETLVFKAARGIEDIYELTYIRKDGSRFPAIVSVTALRTRQPLSSERPTAAASCSARAGLWMSMSSWEKNRELCWPMISLAS